MEVIHCILGKANPKRLNGVNRVVHQLASEQAESGRKVRLFGISKNLDHDYGQRAYSTEIFLPHRNPFFIHSDLKTTIRSLDKDTVFHLHGGWIPMYTQLSDCLVKNNIPFVFTPHGAYNTIAMRKSAYKKKVYFSFFEKTVLQRVSKIHSLGSSELSGINQIFPNEKNVLLPYGYRSRLSPTFSSKKNDEFIIGFMGRLAIYTKGIDLIIKALEGLKKKISNFRLWIIGDSDQKPQLEKWIEEAGLDKHVVLWGAKFGEEKVELMRQMDIFLHPSRNEGIPVAALEASELGVPCILSEATNLGSYFENRRSALIIKDNDVDDLESALLEMVQIKAKGSLHSMGKEASMVVHTAFDWNNLLVQYDKMYTL